MPDLLETPPPANAPTTLPQRKSRFKFTRENAREYAAKGNQVRWHSPQSPEIPNATTERIANEDFTSRKIIRARTQIEQIENLLEAATAPQDVDRLASALGRLYEIERVLAGRPLPGSRRPREDRARVSAGWIELQPALPVAQVAPAPAPAPNDVTCCAPAKPLGWEYDDPNAAACGVDTPTGSVPSSIPDSQKPQDNPVQ